MDTGASLDLDRMLQNLMSNPEMLKTAFEMAGKLSESGALGSLLSGLGSSGGTSPEEKTTPAEESAAGAFSGTASATGAAGTAGVAGTATPVLPASKEHRRRDMSRHRKLLEALELYVSEDKRDKLELVIRLLDIVELAGRMGL